VRPSVVMLASLLCGCSLILDFSDSAIPKDAAIDMPYTQAECDYKEPNDTLDTAAMITTADVGPAAICAGATEDHDFYRFTVPAGTTSVTIKISFTSSPTGDLDLRLYDGTTHVVVSQSRGFGNDETITCPASSPACAMLAAGDYIFEVFPAVNGAVNAYDISLTMMP
jgi:Bacterial pre-peptidase C-terminal domain